MKKNSSSGTYTAPGTPDYGYNNVGQVQNSSRRHISSTAFMSFNSGRAFPSKWDDAERWITSPISSHAFSKVSDSQTQRRPKSKSGPLQIPAVAYLSSYSPAVHKLDGRSSRKFTVRAENRVDQSCSIPGWAELLAEASLSNSQDGKVVSDEKDTKTTVLSSVVSKRRDMGTQMSRVGSTKSSSLSTDSRSVKEEIRDVEMDKGANVTSHSKRQVIDVDDLAESSRMNISELQKEELKINAWENSQKAKAEAAIRKLEMKLEKERSVSVDKILNKLRVAEKKADEARRLLSINFANGAHKKLDKGLSFHKYVKMGSLCGCFT